MNQDIFLLISYVFLSVYGLMKLKIASLGFNWPFIIGFASYALGFVIWLKLLRSMDLSVAFPIAAGSLIIATQVAGVLFLNEQLTVYRWIGVVLMLIGVFVIYGNK